MMARRVRQHGWAATPLGPIPEWPDALRSAVDLVLDAGFPMILFWGGERTVAAYNDAYRSVLGDKAEALGRDFLDVWSEATDVIGPEVEKAFRGEATFRKSAPFFPLRRGEASEPAWFDYQFSPVRGGDGAVAGVLNLGIEVTERVLAERAEAEATRSLREREERHAVLLALSDVLAVHSDPVEVQKAACGVVGEHLDVDVAQYTELDFERRIMITVRDDRRGDMPSPVAEYPIEVFPAHVAAWEAGRTTVIDDMETADAQGEAERDGFLVEGTRAALAVPIMRSGRPVAVMSAICTAPRTWTSTDEALLKEANARTTDAVMRARAEASLRKSEERYRTLFDALDEGFCEIEVRIDGDDERIDYRVVEANPAFYTQTGFPEEILGQWLREAAPALEEHWHEIYGRVARTGVPARFEETSDYLNRTFDVYAFPVFGLQDNRVGIRFRDISERKRAEEHARLLMREVNHRSKNMLSLVQAIARQTAASEPKEFVARFGERVRALAASQDLLVQHAWTSIPISELLTSQLAHFSDLIGKRIDLSGAPLSVTPSAAQALGIAVHELATNAAKYGALSNGEGRISITWDVEEEASPDPIFTLAWKERGGPPIAEAERTGFGTTVTTRMLEASTRGEVSAEFSPVGLNWRFSVPSANILEETAPRGAASRPATAPDRGKEPRGSLVLVVEDDPLIADDMASMLTEAGFAVLGPAADVKHAHSMLESHTCDAAVLDVNLGHETSEPVAQALFASNTPFIVVSGYTSRQLPGVFRGVPLVNKPVHKAELVCELRRALRLETARE